MLGKKEVDRKLEGKIGEQEEGVREGKGMGKGRRKGDGEGMGNEGCGKGKWDGD